MEKRAVKFNHSRLLGRIKEMGFTQEQLAEAMGISAFTVSKKINNKSSFDASEMIAIGKALCIPVDEFGEYFFVV